MMQRQLIEYKIIDLNTDKVLELITAYSANHAIKLYIQNTGYRINIKAI